MNKITFYNDTFLDCKAFQVMGLSVKEEGAIGMFGTGMKYAIATALRLGDKITILSSGERYEFGTKKEDFRGEEVEIVTCNGKSLNFTTQLGKLWEAWMSYREFACNAWDEGGDVTEGESKAMTQVIVTGNALSQIHARRSNYFLRDQAPIAVVNGLEVYRGVGRDIFYKGVRVGEFNAEMPYRFNITKTVALTEDRTVKSVWDVLYDIGTSIAQLQNKELIRDLLESGGVKGQIYFSLADEPSKEFLDVVEERLKESPAQMPNGFRDQYIKHKGNLTPEKSAPTPEQQKRIDRAKKFLGKAGYYINQQIFIIEAVGDKLFGRAKDGEIWLTAKAFEHGSFDLVSTILEEYAHNHTKHKDMTREFQDWLFRQVVLQAEKSVDMVL